jgi:hypothetical protein
MDSGDTVFDRDAESYADDFHACFVECYHMKDWLINDPTFDRATKRDIEKHVNDTPSLRFCADLANLKKHFILNSSRNKDGEIQGIRFVFSVRDWSSDEDTYCECIEAENANSIRRKWLECGLNQSDIRIQVFGDVIVDGDWIGHGFDGISDLVAQAVEAWRKFIFPED